MNSRFALNSVPPSFDTARRALVLACVNGVGHALAIGVIMPLIGLYAAGLGASPALIGIMMSSFGFVPMLIALPVGIMTDRRSPRTILQWGALSTFGGLILLVATSGYTGLLFSYTIMGCAHALSLVASQSYVAAISTPANRLTYFGYYGGSTAFGNTIAPAVAGAVVTIAAGFVATEVASYRVAFLVAAIFAVAPAVSSFLLPETPGHSQPPRLTECLGGLMRNPGMHLVFIATFVHIFSWATRVYFYPLYLHSQQYSTASIGLLFAVGGAAALVVRPLLGVIVRRWHRMVVFYSSLVLLVVSCMTIPLSPHGAFQVFNALLAGVSNGLIQPLTIAQVASSCDPREQGMGMGLRFVVNRMAVVVAPASFGILAEFFSIDQTFVLSGAGLLLLLAGAAVWSIRQTRQVAKVTSEVNP